LAPPELKAFADAERAFGLFGDEQALDAFLRSIDLDRLEDVIVALETYEIDYPPDSVGSTLVVLLNLLPDLPERKRGMWSLVDTRLVAGRVNLRLLRVLPDAESVELVVRETLPRITTLSSKLELIHTVGHEEHVGHKLVSEEAAAELQAELHEQVHASMAEDFVKDSDVFRLLVNVQRREPEGEIALRVFDDARLNEKILLGALTEIRSQSMGNRAMRRQSRLHWGTLIKLYGSEDHLRDAVASVRCRAGYNPKLAEMLELADQYLSGWRPQGFDDDED